MANPSDNSLCVRQASIQSMLVPHGNNQIFLENFW